MAVWIDFCCAELGAMRPVTIVGAGITGATIARFLADGGVEVHVIEARDHLAGNCHTLRDADTGILCHHYGPHIFHTNRVEVWDFVRRFAEFLPYRHRVLARVGGRVYPLPINLLTLNQIFDAAMTPAEAAQFISQQSKGTGGNSFEAAAIARIGPRLYEMFFKGYTQKQWGRDPRDLPARVFSRLPVRFTYDDSYFDHPHQAQPRAGYTEMVKSMLDHPLISLSLNRRFQRGETQGQVFYSGTIDGYFRHCFGRLSYRTLEFEHRRETGSGQGCAVMNYCDASVPYTRVTEHRFFTPWAHHRKTILTREYARDACAGDIPFYPLNALDGKARLARYQALAARETGVSFVGRLGTYRYLDMDVAIAEAISAAQDFLARNRARASLDENTT